MNCPTKNWFCCSALPFKSQSLPPHTQTAMLSCPLKLSAFRLCINYRPQTVYTNFAYLIEPTTHSNFHTFIVKNKSPCVGPGLFSSCKERYSCRAIHKDINTSQKSHVVESQDELKSDFLEEPDLTPNVNMDRRQRINKVDGKDEKGVHRTKKVGHGNKARIPWNKGRKHSEETRERIRRRTKEALKDPKIRKKMSEAPRTLSNKTKARIRASLTKLWGQRLKWKRSREKFLQSWAESIAKAAKIGGSDQQELEWDSYEKIKGEIALEEIHREAEKAKAKEMARIQAERAAQVKAEKRARLAQKRREREEIAKSRGESIKKRSTKSKEEKEKLAEFQEERLKERLMKIRKKKSMISQVSNQHQRSWEKLDLNFTKEERSQMDTSLADQIRFAKKRREEQLLNQL